MYPFIRMALTMAKAKRMGHLPIDGTHESHHVAAPWDIDVFGEVNNGRILSLYDLGRFGLAVRMGLTRTLREQRWGLTIAGTSIRYRKRLLAFQRYSVRSRAVGRDDRFVYISQSMWRGDIALSHALFRTAVVDKDGIVPPRTVLDALAIEDWEPTLPSYVTNWKSAESTRPWPPVD